MVDEGGVEALRRRLEQAESKFAAVISVLEANKRDVAQLSEIVARQADSPKYLFRQLLRALNARIIKSIEATKRSRINTLSFDISHATESDLIEYDIMALHQYQYSILRDKGFSYIFLHGLYRLLRSMAGKVLLRPLRFVIGFIRGFVR